MGLWQGADVNVHVGVIEDFVQDDQHPLPPHSVEPCSETGGLDIFHSEIYHLLFQLPKTFLKGCLCRLAKAARFTKEMEDEPWWISDRHIWWIGDGHSRRACNGHSSNAAILSCY